MLEIAREELQDLMFSQAFSHDHYVTFWASAVRS